MKSSCRSYFNASIGVNFASSNRVSESGSWVVVGFQPQVLNDVSEQMGALYFTARARGFDPRAVGVEPVELRLE